MTPDIAADQPKPATTEEFIAAWNEGGGSPIRVATILGINIRNVYARRDRLRSVGTDLPTQSLNPGYARKPWTYPREIALTLPAGSVVLIGGDGHAWPGEIPPIWRAFAKVARDIRPAAIILNGDMIDGTRISSHPRLRNQNAPRVVDEVEAFQTWLQLLPKATHQIWTLGNHDMRVDRYLANMAPEMDDWAGALTDRFEDWQFCYAASVNDTVEARHRFRGGIHAAYNNALHSGITCVTNHTHQLSRTAITDRRGVRWGVETGMLNDPLAPVFEYSEGAPSRQRSGFVVLTVGDDGDIHPPEMCEWLNGKAMFRNQAVDWRPRVRVSAGSAPA